MLKILEYSFWHTFSYLTTFNIHKGRYRFWRMLFGLKMSQDVFQMRDWQHHIWVTRYHLHTWWHLHIWKGPARNTMALNLIVTNATSVNHKYPPMEPYFQHKEWSLTPKKVKPCKTFWHHKPKKNYNDILGLVNYLQPFLPDLAHKTIRLHEQVNTWDWTPSTDTSFHRLNQWISNTLLKSTLTHYDPTQPVQIHTYASEYGLGTALMQNNHPIAFAAKTLTDVKTG